MPSRGKHKSVMLTAEVMPGTSKTTAEEAKKLKADKPTESSTTEELNVYMIKTFKIRRDFITKEQPTIAQVKETYPELFRYRQIMVEFERVTNTDVDHILQEYCVAHWHDIFDMCKKITSAASLLKQADEVKKENPSMKQYWDMVTALCLIPFMMKEKLCNLVIQVGKDEQVDPKGKIAPVLISKGTVFESDEFTIIAEEEVIQEFTEFTIAFASLFAMYWILNLKYPDSLQLTYSFIQKIIVNLNDGTALPATCRDVQQNLLNSARARTRKNSRKKKHEKPESANGIK